MLMCLRLPLQDYSKEERKDLAFKSRAAPPRFGNAERQQLTNMIHERMLQREKVGRCTEAC